MNIGGIEHIKNLNCYRPDIYPKAVLPFISSPFPTPCISPPISRSPTSLSTLFAGKLSQLTRFRLFKAYSCYGSSGPAHVGRRKGAVYADPRRGEGNRRLPFWEKSITVNGALGSRARYHFYCTIPIWRSLKGAKWNRAKSQISFSQGFHILNHP